MSDKIVHISGTKGLGYVVLNTFVKVSIIELLNQ